MQQRLQAVGEHVEGVDHVANARVAEASGFPRNHGFHARFLSRRVFASGKAAAVGAAASAADAQEEAQGRAADEEVLWGACELRDACCRW